MFCPSVFSVTAFSISNLPCNPRAIISFMSANVNDCDLFLSNGCAICPANPPSLIYGVPNTVFGYLSKSYTNSRLLFFK